MTSLRTGLDVTFSATMLAVVLVLLTFALDPRPADKMAHLWGRYAVMTGERGACPTSFGNSFWFACASEVRRLAG